MIGAVKIVAIDDDVAIVSIIVGGANLVSFAHPYQPFGPCFGNDHSVLHVSPPGDTARAGVEPAQLPSGLDIVETFIPY